MQTMKQIAVLLTSCGLKPLKNVKKSVMVAYFNVKAQPNIINRLILALSDSIFGWSDEDGYYSTITLDKYINAHCKTKTYFGNGYYRGFGQQFMSEFWHFTIPNVPSNVPLNMKQAIDIITELPVVILPIWFSDRDIINNEAEFIELYYAMILSSLASIACSPSHAVIAGNVLMRAARLLSELLSRNKRLLKLCGYTEQEKETFRKNMRKLNKLSTWMVPLFKLMGLIHYPENKSKDGTQAKLTLIDRCVQAVTSASAAGSTGAVTGIWAETWAWIDSCELIAAVGCELFKIPDLFVNNDALWLEDYDIREQVLYDIAHQNWKSDMKEGLSYDYNEEVDKI